MKVRNDSKNTMNFSNRTLFLHTGKKMATCSVISSFRAIYDYTDVL